MQLIRFQYLQNEHKGKENSYIVSRVHGEMIVFYITDDHYIPLQTSDSTAVDFSVEFW